MTGDARPTGRCGGYGIRSMPTTNIVALIEGAGSLVNTCLNQDTQDLRIYRIETPESHIEPIGQKE